MWEKSEQLLRRELALARRREDKFVEALVWGDLGYLYGRRGDWGKAWECLGKGLERAYGLEKEDLREGALAAIAIKLAQLGQMEQALLHAENIKDSVWRSLAYEWVIYEMVWRGELERAKELVGQVELENLREHLERFLEEQVKGSVGAKLSKEACWRNK